MNDTESSVESWMVPLLGRWAVTDGPGDLGRVVRVDLVSEYNPAPRFILEDLNGDRSYSDKVYFLNKLDSARLDVAFPREEKEDE